MAGKISSEIKKHGDTYTANQALEKAFELQQNKAANTFLQQTVKYEPIESQVLAMRSQRTEMVTTKSNKWRNNRRQVPTKQAEQQNNRREWKCKRCGGQHQKTRECPAANKTCHKCGKNGHFARACLGKNFKHRIQSIQAEQEIDMAEYEDKPTVRYQASQAPNSKHPSRTRDRHGRVRGQTHSTVPSKSNQSLRQNKPSQRATGARTPGRQKDSDGHNPIRKNPKRRNKGLFKDESRHMCRYQHST